MQNNEIPGMPNFLARPINDMEKMFLGDQKLLWPGTRCPCHLMILHIKLDICPKVMAETNRAAFLEMYWVIMSQIQKA